MVDDGGIIRNYKGATLRFISVLCDSAGCECGDAEGGGNESKGIDEHLDDYHN